MGNTNYFNLCNPVNSKNASSSRMWLKCSNYSSFETMNTTKNTTLDSVIKCIGWFLHFNCKTCDFLDRVLDIYYIVTSFNSTFRFYLCYPCECYLDIYYRPILFCKFYSSVLFETVLLYYVACKISCRCLPYIMLRVKLVVDAYRILCCV